MGTSGRSNDDALGGLAPPATSASERFLSAWKCLESELGKRYEQAQPHRRADIVPLLRWAEKTRLLSPSAVSFALQCRDARNAYAHVSFEGYSGPVTNPPTEVIYRLERISSTLRHPARASASAAAAVTCTPTCPLHQALSIMREHDFSQLPYLHDQHGWLLVTREQIARWLEVEADIDGTALVDLRATVGSLADDPRIGPVRPRTLPATATVSTALEELEAALCTPDSEDGGYALVMLVASAPEDRPRVLTSDDLPEMYDLLGR